jgi:hypothetical protein
METETETDKTDRRSDGEREGGKERWDEGTVREARRAGGTQGWKDNGPNSSI